ncbi:hypothetical protein DAI22_05g247900 [Oryza sativa Japonica Group]|nr:hypothetical protein DAI22_05g247900 [Oryza sativa Japonica Group]
MHTSLDPSIESISFLLISFIPAMESSSRSPCICKLLPMLMLHVVLLAPPLLQARPLALGHGHRLLESSPPPGGSTKPLSDDDGKPPLGIAPPSPQGNKPPITSPRLRTSTDPPLRPPAPADDAAGLLRLIRDAVEYVIGELEA